MFIWLTGWKIDGNIPPHIKKCVIIGAPHTSSWDFPYGMATLKILKIDIKYLYKKELHVFPVKFIFDASGGIPIDRSVKGDWVNKIIEQFNSSDEFFFALAPEATRSDATRWKGGFYYIAVGAKVPILMAYLDYKTKTAGFGPLLYPTGDIDVDFKEIKSFYSSIIGKNDEQFNRDAIRATSNLIIFGSLFYF